jgi:tyrosyl-tRNA synthetase
MDIARKKSVIRLTKCTQIMGRRVEDKCATCFQPVYETFPMANLMYPAMQAADTFFLKADIIQMGVDQKKVSLLAREYWDQTYTTDSGFTKPIIISHHMIMGLKEGQDKMSKSDPDSAIFMEDTEQEVNRKIKQAYCKPGEVIGNPILDYTKHLIFPTLTFYNFGDFIVDHKKKFGGNLVYTDYSQLEQDFVSGNLHPGDLKPSVAKYINIFLEPVRKHFVNDSKANELLGKVKQFRITK